MTPESMEATVAGCWCAFLAEGGRSRSGGNRGSFRAVWGDAAEQSVTIGVAEKAPAGDTASVGYGWLEAARTMCGAAWTTTGARATVEVRA